MKELFTTYTVDEIVIFIILLAFAIKELITFIDWAKERFKKQVDTAVEEENSETELLSKINSVDGKMKDIADAINKNEETIGEMKKTINLLVESDKDDIKAWITEKHHYFVYELGYIDDYNLDCMEKRFKHYQDEKGNSFAGDLMDEVRKLPKVSTLNKK